MAFRVAADTKLIDVVEYLVEKGAQVNAKDSVRIECTISFTYRLHVVILLYSFQNSAYMQMIIR